MEGEEGGGRREWRERMGLERRKVIDFSQHFLLV